MDLLLLLFCVVCVVIRHDFRKWLKCHDTLLIVLGQTSSTRLSETVGQPIENDKLETGLEARKSYDRQGAKPKERFSSPEQSLSSSEKAEQPGLLCAK